MNVADIKQTITDIEDSSWWNYILMAAAILSFIVAAKNIATYTAQIAQLNETGDVTETDTTTS